MSRDRKVIFALLVVVVFLVIITPVFIENYRRLIAGVKLKYGVDFEAGY